MKILDRTSNPVERCIAWITGQFTKVHIAIHDMMILMRKRVMLEDSEGNERGDVPGWVLVVLMTTGLVTAIWMIAAPRLTAILRNSLDSMNGIR